MYSRSIVVFLFHLLFGGGDFDWMSVMYLVTPAFLMFCVASGSCSMSKEYIFALLLWFFARPNAMQMVDFALNVPTSTIIAFWGKRFAASYRVSASYSLMSPSISWNA